MSTRSEIRSQCRVILNETDSANTHFSDTNINEYIDQAQTFLASLIEYPRKFSSGTQAIDDTAKYALPTDNLIIISIYFGDISIANDIHPLQIVSEEVLTSMFPQWLDATSSTKGRPQYAVVIDRNDILLYPRPDSENSATGKKIYIDYVYVPASLASDSASPDLPLPYHNLIQFYVAHLAYLRLQQQDASIQSLKIFAEKVKALKSVVVKETQQSLGWQWGVHEGGSTELIYGGVRFT